MERERKGEMRACVCAKIDRTSKLNCTQSSTSKQTPQTGERRQGWPPEHGLHDQLPLLKCSSS